MDVLARYKFHLIWSIAAILALFVYLFWNVNANFLGIVETRTHKLGALESGKISKIYPVLGQEVHTNEVLAELDTRDLEIKRIALENELQRMRDNLGADQYRYALEYEKLRLQRDGDKRELAAKRAELNALNTEIARLQKAEQAGLGRSKNLSDLIIRRDSVAQFIAGVASGHETKRSLKIPGLTSEAEPIVLSMLSDSVRRINDVELELNIIEERIGQRRVVSPCNGKVVKINYLPGDAVEGFATILTIEEPTATFIDVYIPETSNNKPHLGERVDVYPSRADVNNTSGTIVFIDPGYSAVPERLAFRKIIYWARKFRVRLDENHGLMPGETVEVRMLGDIEPLNVAWAEETHQETKQAQQPETRTAGSLSEMTVPDDLLTINHFEPSGIAWLADIERFVIASDDTSRGEREHAPWLYLMDKSGNVEPQPLPVDGIDRLNDVEAIAPCSDGSLYLVSSQSISKKGKRRANRQQLLKVERKGRKLNVVGKVDFFKALYDSYDGQTLKALGLGEKRDDQLVLNIEGAAFFGDDLLLGIKQPSTEKGAPIWRLKHPEHLLATGVLDPGQLSVFAFVDLRTPDGRPMGISDLATNDRRQLYALATVADVPEKSQIGAMFKLGFDHSGALQATRLFSFPELKAEGLCFPANDRVYIVFDTDDKSPFLYLTTAMVQL